MEDEKKETVDEKKESSSDEKKDEHKHDSKPEIKKLKSEEIKSEEIKKSEPKPATNIKIEDDDIINFSEIKQKIQKNPWIISTIILGILALVFLVMVLRTNNVTGNSTTNTSVNTNGEELAQSLVKYLNTKTGGGVEYVSYEDAGEDLYAVNVKFQGKEIPVYMTKDGEYFVQGAISLKEAANEPKPSTPDTPDIPKSDKPQVELFVMSLCPFGTQMEKGILPVIEKLGDKIDFKLKFVSYSMHGKKEMDQNTVQYCIQKNEPDKLTDYLSCYLEKNDESHWDDCVKKLGIDKTKLDKCIADTDKEFKISELYKDKSTWSGGRFPQYNVDKEDNAKYGVQGSPTLVINGQNAASARDSASLLKTICSGFNNAPEECNSDLSSESPSPGFGYTGSAGSDTNAQCG